MSNIEIVYRCIDELKPYDNNPRVNDDAVQYVENSIRRFGFRVPMVVSPDNVIICGHTRFEAARKLGVENVPVIVADDLTDEQIKAFRLVDNKISELSFWDYEKLKQEIEDIGQGTLEEFGFVQAIYDDMSDYFTSAEEHTGTRHLKKVTCPCCGRQIVTDKEYNVINDENTTDGY